jgi:hypothetical protein
MDQKGQFYLIAAIIIIGIMIGFAAVSNYAQKRGTIKLYDLGDELGIESANVLDYGTYSELNETQMQALLSSFVQNYCIYAGEGRNLYFIFGNEQKITIMGCQELTSEISLESGGNILIIGGEETFSEEFFPGSRLVVITINDVEYKFHLKSGENFYFIIYEEVGGEEHVVTN